ncbi:hypothetical protein COT97_05815 [Candidatus Falkowbacteria bacterium CG10_big_fil_rev_8_21_14_0_10_39_11]|uniref:Transmembrane protein n=1 Tax=Candidatus Falkowbacteria bacterium CG10_big_fil_rev_8_21_14_0_10_39_11 TaxID=1974565 RepID=A0A2H0V3D4_9BACT|nr:MAG: hypothetical protein COT97_05815 [Candidatus Falkowbacteria bacterium CG10_big_fil_rev_8_21_14_0_10_39_11]
MAKVNELLTFFIICYIILYNLPTTSIRHYKEPIMVPRARGGQDGDQQDVGGPGGWKCRNFLIVGDAILVVLGISIPGSRPSRMRADGFLHP